MAIQDLLRTLGQRVGTGLERMGATTDPTLSPEAQRLTGIQNLSQALRRTGATLSGDPQRMALQAQEDERLRQRRLAEDQKRRLNQFLASPEGAKYQGMGELLGTQSLPLIAQQEFKGKEALFGGQGVTNQFYNILLEGQRNPSVRKSPMYKTAHDYLSQDKTETYINEFGQQVTRKIPGLISKEDYLPPIGFEDRDEEATETEIGKEEVIKVSPERRKILENQIDTVNNSERKIISFIQKLDEIQPGPLTFGEDRADIQSQYTAVLLELKNLEELGVLAGPDLDLLQSMVGDPTGFQQFFISGGTAGIRKQLDNLLQSIGDRKNPIYKELGIKEPEGTITQTKQTAYLNGRKIVVNEAKTQRNDR